LKQWLDNEWIRLVACNPGDHALFLYSQEGWQMAEPAIENPVPLATRSEKIIVGQARTIPVHRLTRSNV